MMTWAKRAVIGSGLAVASLLVVPATAGAADPGCYTGCTAAVVVPPSPDGSSALPFTAAQTTTTNGSSSLPFTGADVAELAVVGVAAVVTGGILARRRRASV